MSAIFGVFRLESAPVERCALEAMAAPLQRRGPDRTGHWLGDAVALGQCLLATTPEAVTENLPLIDAETGCVITADVRLDNRSEVIAALRLAPTTPAIGDGELILRAYLAWGSQCAARLLGDFAFAIWDPRYQRLVCARDKTGMRQLIYHHAPGRLFAFATEPGAILNVAGVSKTINEGRIADFLVGTLEAADFTSTFFEGIYRLPPAHLLVVDRNGLKIDRYWRLEIGPELKLKSGEEYAEAFLDVFTQAVQARLRSPDPVGAMLSGGMDSGTIVAVASRLLAEARQGPLRTISVAGPDPASCVETRAIHAALTMGGLDPTVLVYTRLGDLLPHLSAALRCLDEPFDYDMNLIRAVYLAANRSGTKVVLDGASADLVLTHGDTLDRLIRSGQWRRAVAEARGEEEFWGPEFPAGRALLSAAFAAFAPDIVFSKVKAARRAKAMAASIESSAIDPDFARRVNLPERIKASRRNATSRWDSLPTRRLASMQDPGLTVGRERYDRVAGALAIEPRDPFMDTRVMELCLRLPARQLVRDGWPKYILRRSTQGLLPDEVRWRRGKQHLGPEITSAIVAAIEHQAGDAPFALTPAAARFVKKSITYRGIEAREPRDLARDEAYAQLLAFANWHARYACEAGNCRPKGR